MTLTDAELDAIEARARRATAAPDGGALEMDSRAPAGYDTKGWGFVEGVDEDAKYIEPNERDGALFANARKDVLVLVAEVRRLRGLVVRAVPLIEPCVEVDEGTTPIVCGGCEPCLLVEELTAEARR